MENEEPKPIGVGHDAGPHPWSEPELARLYDLFPFTDDLPLYEELAAAQGGRVLEPACGTGRVAIPLARAGFTVVGIDSSPHMLALAERKLGAEPAGVRARCRLGHGEMTSFAVEGSRFGFAVIAVQSFCYLTEVRDQLAALSCVREHLVPDGLLALDLRQPTPEWIMQPDGALVQDLAVRLLDGSVVTRTECPVGTDRSRQVRTIRSIYERVDPDGGVWKRVVEWPFRWFHRFEAEHLLTRAGFTVEAVHGGYAREPFTSDSQTMLILARVP